MIVGLRVATVEERHVVHVTGNVRKNFRDVGAALSMPLKLKGRPQALAAGGEEAGLGVGAVELLSIPFAQLRLVVKGVDLRGAARLEEPDDGLCPRRAGWVPDLQGVGGCVCGLQDPLFVQERSKGYATGAEAGFLQESAAVQVSQLIFRHDGFRNRWFSQ